MTRFIYSIIFFFLIAHAGAQVQLKNLTCEMRTNPVGIDVLAPRFSWQLESKERNVVQQSYQLLVSSEASMLKNNQGDMWMAGLVQSDSSLNIVYKGKALQPGKKYFWKILVKTNKENDALSGEGFFTMGLLAPADWKAKWIGYDKASPWDSITQWSRLSARYLRKEFETTPSIARATAYISGLGMYELFINGKRIGDQVLAPAPTDYRKTFFYNSFDVTGNLQPGKNALAVILGNGRFFTMRQDYKPYKISTFGYPKLLLQLEVEYSDGTKKIIATDDTWKLNVDGPIRTNNEYDGEEYDAAKEFPGWINASFDDGKWIKPELVKAPEGKLVAQMSPMMKVMQTIPPISIKNVNGKYILDLGQNFAGWLHLRNIKGKKGDKITLKFAESLDANGGLYTANLRDARVTDVYSFNNNGLGQEGWHPTFVYHGFRYVEVSGFPGIPSLNNFEGQLVYDNMPTTGSFQTSDTTINAVYRNAWWGIASNYKGMPIDCPQRNERQPWLGDRTIGQQGESYVFNNQKLYAKWMDDIEQSQTAEGAIPDVAPAFWNYYSDDVTWPAAFITISNSLYNQFGDLRPIEKHYPAMKHWVMYMRSKYMQNSIMTKDKYGDWCVPPENLELIHAKDSSRLTDGKLIASAYFYKLLSYMQRFAKLTSNDKDAVYYGSLADSMRTAFQNTFYKPGKKYYSNNTITANLLPLYFGITPDSLRDVVFDHIREKIMVDNNGHIATGLIGTQFLMRSLTEYGADDIAYKLASNRTYPSWGYMVANGATTIWELWNGNTAAPAMNSQNHVMMLGDLLTWFYENLGGIRPDKTQVGFKKIIMRPTIPDGLSFVNAAYESNHGLVKSSWKKEGSLLHWDVSIPANTSAVLYIPCTALESLKESGQQLGAGVRLVKWEKGIATINIGSGDYKFSSQFK